MTSTAARDVILLVFANDRAGDGAAYLRNLAEERRRIMRALAPLADPYTVVAEPNITRRQLFDLVREHGERVVGVHFGGHADPGALFIEDGEGWPEGLNITGLAGRLATMKQLRWVFLNGCSTQGQIEALHAEVGAPAIVTERAIRDDAAVEFAEEFYASLASGCTLAESFAAARDRLESYGGDGVHRFLRPQMQTEDGAPPWRLVDPPSRPEGRHWRLLPAAQVSTAPTDAGMRLRRQQAEPPGAPTDPYPQVLGHYTDRRLFAGRERELATLRRLIEQTQILCVWARSGAGKSSILAAGLAPALRDEAVPVAINRGPHEASAPRLLLGELLCPAPAAVDPHSFAAALRAAHRLAGGPPVLVLDQFEELFKGPDAFTARARLGPYLAASMGPGPALGDGVERPLCRWVLAYRHEFHGDVDSWLGDVLTEAKATGADVAGLPHDLNIGGRSARWPLPLFGAPMAGESSEAAARAAFRAAITRPLARVEPPWSIADDDADRLAGAFSVARKRDPGQPLVPELQVVLARLVRRAEAAGRRVLEVADDAALDADIEDALRSHVLRSVQQVLPVGQPGVKQRRALLLTALARLADDAVHRSKRLPADALAAVLGADGGDGVALLDALTRSGVRLLTVEADEEHGRCYALAHDRLAEVIAGLVADAPHGSFDPQTLELVEFVRRRVELHRHDDPAGMARDDERFDRLAEAPDVRADAAHAAWWDAWAAETRRQRAREADAAEASRRRVGEEARQLKGAHRRSWLLAAVAALLVAGLAALGWQQGWFATVDSGAIESGLGAERGDPGRVAASAGSEIDATPPLVDATPPPIDATPPTHRPLVLLAGFDLYRRGYAEPMCTVQNGLVTLSGMVEREKTSGSEHITTLLPECRPPVRLTTHGNAHERAVRLDIYPDGRVFLVERTAPGLGWFSLNGVSYPQESGEPIPLAPGIDANDDFGVYGVPSARKLGELVTLTGAVMVEERAGNQVLGRLPVGMRPDTSISLEAYANEANEKRLDNARINVHPDGRLELCGGTFRSGTRWLSLAGLVFAVSRGEAVTIEGHVKAYGGVWIGPHVTVDGGLACLTGMIKSKSWGHVATLPTKIHPAGGKQVFELNAHDQGVRMTVQSDGKLMVDAETGPIPRGWVSLSGVCFPVR